LLSLLSAVLLILSFPKTDYSFLAWVGLIPLFFSLDGKSIGKSFLFSYFCGLVFFGGTLYWICHVTVAGFLLMIAYLSLYFGLFGVVYKLSQKQSLLRRAILCPSSWVVLEYIREHAMTGFGWASLGLSQYKNHLLIQFVDITGMLGVSFLIVLVNVVLKDLVAWKLAKKAGLPKDVRNALIAVFVILFCVISYGVFSLKNNDSDSKVKIGVVQANIMQSMKWNEAFWSRILEKYERLTEKASLVNPDLIIWPETAFPGYIGVDEELYLKVKEIGAKENIPLLFGSVSVVEGNYFNSAVLISGNGKEIKRYNKMHLVPFGEFIPLRKIFPFLSNIAPIGDFTRGEEFTTFDFKGEMFSVLICFEDTVARLSRGFVKNGATLLVNITNDAWFRDTNEPFMHLQASVFRAIENRRSLVRVANTGISCLIDKYGRISDYVKNGKGKITYVSGISVLEAEHNDEITVYTKIGDVFTFICFACILIIASLKLRKTQTV